MGAWVARAWKRHVLPVAIERFCGQGSVERQRRKVVPAARGRVLELGIGSGLNLPHYDPRQVDEVIGVDPSAELLAKAARRASTLGVPARLVQGGIDDLSADEGTFDTVVLTYTLCTIPEPAEALATVARLLAPKGRLVVSEHGAAPDAAPRAWQARLDPVWHRVAGGCHLDRSVVSLLRAAGFDVRALESAYLPGPRWLNHHTWGVLPRAEESS